MSKTGILKSSLSRKYAMALTGLFLCLFLVGHLLGNLQLFVGGEEGREAFNNYAQFMTTNPLVKVLSYLTYAGVIFHIIDGFVLTIQNRKARPVKYVVEKGNLNSSWASRNMAVLGTILLVFLVSHMQSFWYVMHFGDIEIIDGVKDLHSVTLDFFNPAINNLAAVMMGLYVFAMLSMAFHLNHGFQSAFQTMGVNHPKYTPAINFVGKAFSILIPAGFASLPIYLFIIQS
ncbi:MAG: succinate dehydrogenase cytochrome b subunit [Flavobacteriales bacterium]|nr:succinate dehydrogenase cytochrome b subunit [Flavobacteriales bacterium]